MENDETNCHHVKRLSNIFSLKKNIMAVFKKINKYISFLGEKKAKKFLDFMKIIHKFKKLNEHKVQ